jgi:exportin-1
MLQVFPVRGQCDALLAQLMNIPNTSWRTIMQAAGVNTDSLMLPDTVKEVWKILKTNVNVCGSVGPGFLSQMSCIYLDMLNVYKWYSQKISDA